MVCGCLKTCITYFSVCTCTHTGVHQHKATMMLTERPENNLWEFVLSFNHTGPEHLYHPQASLYVFWSTSLLCAHQLYLYWFTPTVNEHSFFFYHCMVFCCMAKAQFIFLLLMGGQPFRTLIELLLFIHKCFKNIFIFWNLNIIISFFHIPSHFFLHTQTCLGHLMLSICMWF